MNPAKGSNMVSLESLPKTMTSRELFSKKSYFAYIDRVGEPSSLGGVIESSGKVLTMPEPKPLTGLMTEREMLRQFPGCENLDGEELIERVKKLVPSLKTLFGNMINTIIECQERRLKVIPTVIGTRTLGFCVDNEKLTILRFDLDVDGWGAIYGDKVDLDREWSDGPLLLLATESSVL